MLMGRIGIRVREKGSMSTNRQVGNSSDRARTPTRAQLLLLPQVEVMWEDLRRGLETVPGFDEYYTVEWVYERVMSGRFQVWAFGEDYAAEPRLIVITQVVEYPKGKVVEMLWTFGEGFRQYRDAMLFLLETFAEMVGADRIRGQGRIGWKRLLRGTGAQVECAVFSRRVNSSNREQ
jgi:hypothetical protein